MLASGGLAVLAVGLVVASPTGLAGTMGGTILVAAITVAADERLAGTAGTLKQSGRSTHQRKG